MMLMEPMWQLANMALGLAFMTLLLFDTAVIGVVSDTPHNALSKSTSETPSSSKLGSNGITEVVTF